LFVLGEMGEPAPVREWLNLCPERRGRITRSCFA
jgi:hypothetical protein